MISNSLPPIPVKKGMGTNKTDSFNPDAFYEQVKKKSFTNYYDDLSKLSSKVESLKQENELLKQELFDIATSSENPTGYHQIKKNILAFTAKNNLREKEVETISKALSAAKKSSEPTLLSSILPKEKNLLGLDSVAESLLISNPQKTFFKAGELEVQNKEIRRLIKMLSNSLQNYKKRLDIYQTCQTENKVSLHIESLKRKQNPPLLAEAAPAQVVEQREKIKLLRKELRTLVNNRLKMQQIDAMAEEESIKAPQSPRTPESSPRTPRSPLSPRNPITLAPRKKKGRKSRKTQAKKDDKTDLQNQSNHQVHEPYPFSAYKENQHVIFAEQSNDENGVNQEQSNSMMNMENSFEDKAIASVSQEKAVIVPQDNIEKTVQKNKDTKENISQQNEKQEETYINNCNDDCDVLKESEINERAHEELESQKDKDNQIEETTFENEKESLLPEEKEDGLRTEEVEEAKPIVDELIADDPETESEREKEENSQPTQSLLPIENADESIVSCAEDELLPQSPKDDKTQEADDNDGGNQRKYSEFWRNV